MSGQPKRTGRARAFANHFFGYLKKSHRTGWRGFAWRWLERIGPVTRSAPLRRGVQVLCLIVFLDLFFRVCWPYADRFNSGVFNAKEYLTAESFLLIDPLVGLSTLIAGKFFNWATLLWAVGILAFCVLIPRAFCGYFCPLGTAIDLFDATIGRLTRRWHLPDNPAGTGSQSGWVNLKYYLLAGVLVTSAFGVLTAGYLSAIPVLTRGLLFTGARLQLAVLKGPTQIKPIDAATIVSLVLFAGVFLLSLRGRRFWCRYVCPSGAVLSVFNLFRVGERKVERSCINCNKCIEICPFDAILEDYTTRTADCTYCQTCGGVCPVDAIKFVSRWNDEELKEETVAEAQNLTAADTGPNPDSATISPPDPRRSEPLSRRGFVAASVLGLAATGLTQASQRVGFGDGGAGRPKPLRPPGSVPEEDFLNLCIRCGECFKVCPGPVLHPGGFADGLESLWTPIADPTHAGCHQDCNFCTQVCPTGAIQPLDLLVKRETHMGLAVVNTETCLPFREEGREDCNLCAIECDAAGYHAITMRPIPLPVDREELQMAGFSDPEIDEMASIPAPHVDPAACVGCGICTYRCHLEYVIDFPKMPEAAIPVIAKNEHRLREFPQMPEELPLPG